MSHLEEAVKGSDSELKKLNSSRCAGRAAWHCRGPCIAEPVAAAAQLLEPTTGGSEACLTG